MNDTINNSSRYFDNRMFRSTFNKYNNYFSILNANIISVDTNLNRLNFFLDDVDYTFPIIEITETSHQPHNLDCFSVKGYSHEYNVRPNRTGNFYT